MRAFLIPALALLLGAAPAAAQTAPADIVLVNGKIVTVDDRFTIAQALAIRDQRIVAVGTNAEIDKLKGPQTRTIELAGRTVIPGLIDNHSHWIRAAEHNELRFDGVTTRKRAIALLNERVRAAKPGEWIAVLGGWSEQQFTDEERGFPRAELDAIAPNNPVVLQSVYNHSYLNSAALKAAGIDESTANPPGGQIEKDADGRLTGVVRGAGGVAFVAAKVPHADQETWFANTRKLVSYLNSLGITAWSDLGGRGMSARHYEPYRRLADAGELNVRVFWLTIRQPATPEQMDKRARGSAAADAVPGQRLFRPHRLGRIDLWARDHQHHARGRPDESGRHGAGAPPGGGARAPGHPSQRPCRDADRHRRLTLSSTRR